MRLGAALAIGLGCIAPVGAQQPAEPFVIARGDFDGDGLLDIVEGRRSDANKPGLVVVRLAAMPERVFQIAAGDDIGKLDVVVGRAGKYPVKVPSDIVTLQSKGGTKEAKRQVVVAGVTVTTTREVVLYRPSPTEQIVGCWHPDLQTFKSYPLVEGAYRLAGDAAEPASPPPDSDVK